MTGTDKPVTRRTGKPYRGRRVIVSVGPGDVIGFRHERTSRVFYTTIEACFDMAVRQATINERRG